MSLHSEHEHKEEEEIYADGVDDDDGVVAWGLYLTIFYDVDTDGNDDNNDDAHNEAGVYLW